MTRARACYGSSDPEIEIYLHENVSQHFYNRILSAKNSSRWVGPIDKCAQKYEKKLMLHGEWWGYILFLQALKKYVGCVVVHLQGQLTLNSIRLIYLTSETTQRVSPLRSFFAGDKKAVTHALLSSRKI